VESLVSKFGPDLSEPNSIAMALEWRSSGCGG
jgi:hypothetical protein